MSKGGLRLLRHRSRSEVCVAIALPPVVVALGLHRQYLLLAIVMTALVIFRFRKNIQRIARGEEPRFQPKREQSPPP